jgi:hypothetical protein
MLYRQYVIIRFYKSTIFVLFTSFFFTSCYGQLSLFWPHTLIPSFPSFQCLFNGITVISFRPQMRLVLSNWLCYVPYKSPTSITGQLCECNYVCVCTSNWWIFRRTKKAQEFFWVLHTTVRNFLHQLHRNGLPNFVLFYCILYWLDLNFFPGSFILNIVWSSAVFISSWASHLYWSGFV